MQVVAPGIISATSASATSSGTFTGSANTIYTIRCIRGGEVDASSGKPLIEWSDDVGNESSAPIEVTALALTIAEAVKITYGTGYLSKGDIWTITCTTAPSTGAATADANNYPTDDPGNRRGTGQDDDGGPGERKGLKVKPDGTVYVALSAVTDLFLALDRRVETISVAALASPSTAVLVACHKIKILNKSDHDMYYRTVASGTYTKVGASGTAVIESPTGVVKTPFVYLEIYHTDTGNTHDVDFEYWEE